MTPVLVALAVLVVAGAVTAVAAATPRLAVLGLFVAMVGAAYVADPIPGPVGLAARLAGTTLGTYLVWIALRRSPGRLPPATAGWIGTSAIAIAAFVAGWLAASGLTALITANAGPGLGATRGLGTALVEGSVVARAAVAASVAMIAVAIPQVVVPRDTLRLGSGCLLILAAAGLAGNALAGQPDPVVELAFALLTALAGAGAAAVIAASIRHGGDLLIRDALRPDAAVRHRAADDAHPTGHGVAVDARPGNDRAAGVGSAADPAA